MLYKNSLGVFVVFFFHIFYSIGGNTEQWIVVTTINYPTEALKRLAQLPNWKMVVVADKKTPKDWNLPNCDFLSIEKQLALRYAITPLLPWNHYSRKNIGYLYAIQHGAKVIYETDDDNLLLDSLVHLPKVAKIKTFETTTLCANPYAYFGQPTVWPRGYPLQDVLNTQDIHYKQKDNVQLFIQQGLVDKDPDVDAIFRLTRDSHIFFKQADPIALPKGCFCPFNSQNTTFHYEAFWGMLLPITTSFRVCDIWRGYVTQRLLWDINGLLCFTSSTAVQERNEHDLLKDFTDEIDLYCKSKHLITFLNKWKSDKKSLFERMKELTKKLIELKFYQDKELEIVKAWIQDLKTIGYTEPVIK